MLPFFLRHYVSYSPFFRTDTESQEFLWVFDWFQFHRWNVKIFVTKFLICSKHIWVRKDVVWCQNVAIVHVSCDRNMLEQRWVPNGPIMFNFGYGNTGEDWRNLIANGCAMGLTKRLATNMKKSEVKT